MNLRQIRKVRRKVARLEYDPATGAKLALRMAYDVPLRRLRRAEPISPTKH